MHISLPPALKAFVEKKYESGRYSSKSEVIHEGLRRLMADEDSYEQKLDALRTEIQKGIDSGEPVDGDVVFARLREKQNRRMMQE